MARASVFAGDAVGGMVKTVNKPEYKPNRPHKYYRCLVGFKLRTKPELVLFTKIRKKLLLI